MGIVQSIPTRRKLQPSVSAFGPQIRIEPRMIRALLLAILTVDRVDYLMRRYAIGYWLSKTQWEGMAMRRHRWTAALAIAVPFALQPTAPNAQSRIGSANSVKADATGSIGGTVPAGNGTHAKKMINAGSSGQAGLGFIDKSSVGPSSNVRVDTSNKGRGTVVIGAAKGAFRFSTGAQGKSDVKVKTPQGMLGLRG